MFSSWLFVVFLCGVAVSESTTPNLHEIFLGRCLWNYERFSLPHDKQHCDNLWELFSGAVLGKDPHHVTRKDFEPYIAASNFTAPIHKTLFWSGNNRLAHDLSGAGGRFFTLENTFSGYLMDNLAWCGSAETNSSFGTNCPSWNDNESMKQFWAGASRTFASLASGQVQGLVYASESTVPPAAFRNDSFFATEELVSLNPDTISNFTIFVRSNPNLPNERCGSGSLVRMVSALKDQLGSIPIACEDDPKRVMWMFCVENPHAEACEFVTQDLEVLESEEGLVMLLVSLLAGILVGWLTLFFAVRCGLFTLPSKNQNKSTLGVSTH